MKINLNEIIDPLEAKVSVKLDDDGQVLSARFDLSGLPRVDGLLVGRHAVEAVEMAEHLCGICPVAHHLAGIRALDVLAGKVLQPGDSAEMVRRLLHYGSIVEAHALRFIVLDREAGIVLKRVSKLMLSAAGSSGHFPVTAVPGGVAVAPQCGVLRDLQLALPKALGGAQRVLDVLGIADKKASGFGGVAFSSGGVAGGFDGGLQFDEDFCGADVALIDCEGNPDVFGSRIRVCRAGSVWFEGDFSVWDELVCEEFPGSVAPRPYLTELGAEQGRYRVGPVAQLSVGALNTPLARQAQLCWENNGRSALSARAIMTLHVLEKTVQLCTDLMQVFSNEFSGGVSGSGIDTNIDLEEAQDRVGLVPDDSDAFNTFDGGDSSAVSGVPGSRPVLVLREGKATGLVDGPRGLLAHTYQVDQEGRIVYCNILTPTAQNEPWLAELLTRATRKTGGERQNALEQSIREADPCLPISSAPAGQMNLKLDIVGLGEEP